MDGNNGGHLLYSPPIRSDYCRSGHRFHTRCQKYTPKCFVREA